MKLRPWKAEIVFQVLHRRGEVVLSVVGDPV